jgi:hypothetical protein
MNIKGFKKNGEILKYDYNALENLPQNDNMFEPMEDDIPKVFIDGVIPTTKDDVLAEMTYISKTEKFHAYLKIKCQGNTSMNFPKKNFTIKMYSDAERETKLKKAFKDWNSEQNKYVLKANWIDHSHSRNIVSARLWGEVIASRSDYDSLPAELKTSPNNGAIDGFPIKVYTNGTYKGIYTWNIGKDDWMWGMDEDNPNHILMCAETNTDGVYAETPCNFRALWSDVNEEDWSIEVGTNSDAVKNSLNALISCVKDTDDETFKATIGNYLDLQSAIDYYLHQYVICGTDGLGKNMLLGTYDLRKWYMGAYDMDATFGNYIIGGIGSILANTRCPEDYQEQFSLLFERICALYSSELAERYAFLRKNVYSIPNMFASFEKFTDIIGTELYNEDLSIYEKIPAGDTNNIKQIRDFIRDRLDYCDRSILGIETDSLYALKGGSKTFSDGTVLTVNGNHVKVELCNNTTGNMHLNLYDVLANTNESENALNVSNKPFWFGVGVGDTIETTFSNIVTDIDLSKVVIKADYKDTIGASVLSSAISVESTDDANSHETLASNFSVACLFMYVSHDNKLDNTSGKTIEFDVGITVNGIKYV